MLWFVQKTMPSAEVIGQSKLSTVGFTGIVIGECFNSDRSMTLSWVFVLSSSMLVSMGPQRVLGLEQMHLKEEIKRLICFFNQENSFFLSPASCLKDQNSKPVKLVIPWVAGRSYVNRENVRRSKLLVRKYLLASTWKLDVSEEKYEQVSSKLESEETAYKTPEVAVCDSPRM